MKYVYFLSCLLLSFSIYAQKVINTTQNPQQNVSDVQSITFENGAEIVATPQSKYFAFIDSNSDGVPDYDTELTSNTLSFEYDSAGNQIKRYYVITISSYSDRLSETIESVYDELEFVDDEKEFFLEVYPNPSKGPIHLKWNDSNIKIIQLELYTLAGNQVNNFTLSNKNNDSLEMNISGLPVGVYLMRFVLSNGKSISKRIIKK